MKILDLTIDWQDYNQGPLIQCKVDHIPNKTDLIYDAYPHGINTIYYAEQEGYCDFFYHCPKDEKGYAGLEFTLRMRDGSMKTIKGPWSGNSDTIREICNKECREVLLCGFYDTTYYVGAITLDLLQDALAKFRPELTLVKSNLGFWDVVFKEGRAKPWMPIDPKILDAIEHKTPIYIEYLRTDQVEKLK